MIFWVDESNGKILNTAYSTYDGSIIFQIFDLRDKDKKWRQQNMFKVNKIKELHYSYRVNVYLF